MLQGKVRVRGTVRLELGLVVVLVLGLGLGLGLGLKLALGFLAFIVRFGFRVRFRTRDYVLG